MKVERITVKEQLRRLIAENGRLDERMWWVEAGASDLAQALDGLMHDMHTGSGSINRGSLGPDDTGCARACPTCDAARKALDKHNEGRKGNE